MTTLGGDPVVEVELSRKLPQSDFEARLHRPDARATAPHLDARRLATRVASGDPDAPKRPAGPAEPRAYGFTSSAQMT